MSGHDSRFQALREFEFDSLRWRRETVLVGDGPDARTCNLWFCARITRCFPSWDLIGFENGKMFCVSNQTIDGKRTYLFRYGPLKALWRRRKPEQLLTEWLRNAPIDEVQIVAEWITEAAGHPMRLWPSREYLLVTVEDHIQSVGVPDLELLADIVRLGLDKSSKSAA